MRDWVRPPRSAQSENRQGCGKLMGMTLIDVLVFDGCEALDVLGPYEVIAYGGLDCGHPDRAKAGAHLAGSRVGGRSAA